MEKQFYFLSPVEVVKVTLQNLAEVAEWCGGRVASTESRKVAGRMDSYVWVPTPKGTSISWAFPGMFITKRLVRTVKDELRVTYAVFRKDYFEKNYFDSPLAAVDATWERDAKAHKKTVKPQLPAEMGKAFGENLHEGVALSKMIPNDTPEVEDDVRATVEEHLEHDKSSGPGEGVPEEAGHKPA